MNMKNLNGKRVVITGGSQGLGLAMVEALAACGVNVIAISRDRANLSSAEHAGAAVIAGDATELTNWKSAPTGRSRHDPDGTCMNN
jgi:NAD(P)-dependent dehydrogenase (short-subunit alcohol dehydrogenase family)